MERYFYENGNHKEARVAILISQINNLTSHLKEIEKEIQMMHRVNTRKETKEQR